MVKFFEKSSQKLLLLLLCSVVALSSAYIAEFIFDYQPCILCLYQRIPFFAVIFVALFALLFWKSRKTQNFVQKVSVWCCVAFLAINALIAFYQVGVEQKVFQGPSTCSSRNLEEITDLKELETALLKTKAVRCDEPQFFFIGLSMAAWNAIYCSGLVLMILLFGNGKTKQKSL